MNDRIQELAEQAIVDVKDEFGHWIGSDFDKEKFAQLIVRDCAKIIESQDVDPSFKLRMSWAIKTRFGIKERKL
jgi:hypothetical protein